RVGVSFTQSQKDLIASLMKTGDVAGAQKVILAELGKEFGGSALASTKSFDGQMVVLKETFNNVLQVLGDALMPVLTDLMNWLSSPAVLSAIQSIASGLGTGI